MEFEQLRQLDAMERAQTMSRAAQVLHISQPALSRSIKRLEADLGQELFEREGRHMHLNEAGRTAVEWARQLLRDEQLMRDAVAAVARRARTLRVATVAPEPLWRLTSLLVERFPQETLTSQTASEDEVVRGVVDGAFDLGIVCDAPTSPLLRSCHLMDERLSVTLPPNHPLAARREVTAQDLDGTTFLLYADIGFWRERVDRELPHAVFIEQRDREVFLRLARTTPHCVFTTDAPFLSDSTPGRAVVPIKGAFAEASYRLVVHAHATGEVAELFRWAEEHA